MKNLKIMNNQMIQYPHPFNSSLDICTDSANYLPNISSIGNNEFFSVNNQSGTTSYDNEIISISLDVYERINQAAHAAPNIDKPKPRQLSKCTSWLASKILAQYKKRPTFINATFDGGIMLEYYLENKLYVMLEFFDDGDIVVLTKEHGIRNTYSFTNIGEIQSLLQSILNGGSLRKSKNSGKTT